VSDEKRHEPTSEHDVDSLLREVASHTEMPSDFKLALKQQLKHNLRYHHNRRRKSWLVGVAALVLTLGLSTEMYLGSNNFEMESHEPVNPNLVTYRDVVGNRSHSYSKNHPIVKKDLKTVSEIISEKEMSGDFSYGGVEGYEVAGNSVIVFDRVYLVDGDSISASAELGTNTMINIQDYLGFLDACSADIKRDHSNGALEYLGEEIIDYPEFSVRLKKWRAGRLQWPDAVYVTGEVLQ
jgi:hypothetical protein